MTTPYSQPEKLLLFLGHAELLGLADDSTPPVRVWQDSEVQAVVASALEQATAEINTYLEARYTLPLPSVPPVLIDICSRLAICFLFDRRPNHDRGTWEDVCKRQRELLEAIADGEVSIGLPEKEEKESPTEDRNSVFVSGKPVLCPGVWRKF